MNDMKKQLKNQKVFTIPNILSMIRILLIPIMIYLYLTKKYLYCAIVLVISYASDIADGIIARHFGLISDIGKILDPFADKLTQASMLVCISITHNIGWILFGLLAIKELMTALAGFFAVRRTGVVSGAKWFGKACTVVLNSMFALMLFIPKLDNVAFYLLAAVCAVAMIASMIAYVLFFTRYYDGKKKQKQK